MSRRGIRIVGHEGLGKHVDARIVSHLNSIVRLEGDGTHPLVELGTSEDDTLGRLEADGALMLGRSSKIDVNAEYLTFDTQSSDRNFVRAYGAVAGNPSGRYQLTLTDSMSIYTHGAISSDGGSQIPGQIALLGKTFMFGCNSDIAAGVDAACYVSFARAAGLDHFQMVSGPSTLRLKIKHDGDLVWSRGGGGTATFTMTPTATGMQIGLSTEYIGFFGKTPSAQPVANPDTSGATLPNVEIEVNQVKQLLRDLGLLAAA